MYRDLKSNNIWKNYAPEFDINYTSSQDNYFQGKAPRKGL